MGLKDLTREQWTQRLKLRSLQLKELGKEVERCRPSDFHNLVDLIQVVQNLSHPMPNRMRRFLEAAAEFEEELIPFFNEEHAIGFAELYLIDRQYGPRSEEHTSELQSHVN